ncbi:hypothetical protein GIB67_007692 [Kingdonia uniflora]|uniref:S-adenosylmethionine decarboxylase proenzyme n=1 Tax=Kingdonia uniflora TaxID=39325 RepID=A0A7J7N1I1_9MAGN|nr:hypothetical protein GIB67_007692 [Kingdonia uniflora]
MRDSEDYTAKEMTKLSEISKILPFYDICDFDFDPYGYSMNAIDGLAFSTIHVTSEDGFSYASYKAMGFDSHSVDFESLIKRTLSYFKLVKFSVAITYDGEVSTWGYTSDVDGYKYVDVVKQKVPSGGCIVYGCFSIVAAVAYFPNSTKRS